MRRSRPVSKPDDRSFPAIAPARRTAIALVSQGNAIALQDGDRTGFASILANSLRTVGA